MLKKINPAAFTAVSLLSILSSSSLQAADNIPVIVVTPSQYAQPVNQVGSTVISLQGDELRQRGIEFIEDALQEIPSLNITSQGARGSLVQARVRGNEANHVLVLIDGMRVSNATTGEFDLSNLSIASVDNIEVLLGAQSIIYGSDAMAGVISITTKSGGIGVAGHVKLKLGETAIRSVAGNINGGDSNWNYSVTVEDFSTDGISSAAEENGNTEQDAFDKQSLNIKAGYASDAFSSTIILGSSDSSFDYDGFDFNGIGVDVAENNQQTESDRISWLISIPSDNELFSNTFQLNSYNNQYNSESFSFGSTSLYSTETDRIDFSYRGGYIFNDFVTFQYGLEKLTEELTVENSDFKQKTGSKDFYLDTLYQIDHVNLTAGFRHTNHDEFGPHNSYRLTASYQLSDSFRVRATHGTAYKTPSLQELFDTSFGGNPDLKPEQSKNSELGLEYNSHNYFFSLTAFYQNTDDLISYVGSYPDGVNQNIGEARNKGVEFSLKKNWQQLTLTTSLTKTEATVSNNGVSVDRLRVPEWAASMLLNYHYDKMRSWLKALYQGDRRDIQFSYPSQDVTLDSYTVWDWGMSYQLMKNISLSVSVENLTDENYEKVFSYGTRGRTASVSAEWIF